MKRLLTMWVLLLPLCALAQTFTAPHLEKAAQKLKLDSLDLRADSLPQVKTIDKNGQSIILRFSSKGEVEHIGIPLFASEVRLLQPSPVYDFLEYATLNKLFKVEDNTLKLDEVKFIKGSWNQLPGILSKSDGFTILNHNDKHYEVDWLKDSQPVVVMQFPINYELLANSEREEMEKRFVKELRAYSNHTPLSPKLDTGKLQSTDNPDVLVQKGQTYLIPAINDNRYVTVASETDTTAHDTVAHEVLRYRLIFDRHNALESLSNLMVEPDMDVDNDSIRLQVKYYNYKRDTLKVSVRNFLSYCVKEGCTPYFGIDEAEGNSITGSLFLVNKASGYVHIMNVSCDTGNLFSGNALIDATMFMFTPTSNVRNLFAEPKTNNHIFQKYIK